MSKLEKFCTIGTVAFMTFLLIATSTSCNHKKDPEQDMREYLNSHWFLDGRDNIAFQNDCMYFNGFLYSQPVNYHAGVRGVGEGGKIITIQMSAYNPARDEHVYFKIDRSKGTLTIEKSGRVYKSRH